MRTDIDGKDRSPLDIEQDAQVRTNHDGVDRLLRFGGKDMDFVCAQAGMEGIDLELLPSLPHEFLLIRGKAMKILPERFRGFVDVVHDPGFAVNS